MNFSDKISEDLALRTDLIHDTTNKKKQQPLKAIFSPWALKLSNSYKAHLRENTQDATYSCL